MEPPEPSRPPAPPDGVPAAPVLADVARIGPWFAVGVVPAGGRWRRWAELYEHPGEREDPLSLRIGQVAATLRTDPHAAADLLARELAGTHLEPLYAAVAARVSVSERVLRGNVVSAIGGAARVLEASRRADRPSFLALLDALVGHPALRGSLPEGATGRLLRLDDADPDTEWAFRRRSCCLYVRVPGGGACGDCVLADRA